MKITELASEEPSPGSTVTVTGWGTNHSTGQGVTPILQKLDVTIATDEELVGIADAFDYVGVKAAPPTGVCYVSKMQQKIPQNSSSGSV